MGITDKIQQKLSGNNNQTEEERRLEQEQGGQWERGPHEKYNAPQTSHVQNPISSSDQRSGIVGGTHPAVGGGPAYPSDTLNTPHTTTGTTTGIPTGRDPTDTRFGGSTNANPLSSTTGTHHVGGTTGSSGLTNTAGTTGLNSNPTTTGHHTGLTGSDPRSGITGGTAVTGGVGSDALDRHDHTTGVSSTSDKLRDTHLGGTTGTTGTTTNTYPVSHNRGSVGDTGSRRDADHPEVRRTAGGGISNGSTDFISGPQHRIENPQNIPTAGGIKPGGVGEEYNTERHHHLGRDAAVAGGTGAGVGAYEAQHHSGPGPAPNTAGPHKSDVLNKLDPRVTADPAKRDDTFAGDRHGHTTGSTTTSGISGTTHHDSHGHGQGSHFSNTRAATNEPLTHDRDFNDRHQHGHTGAGLGTAAGVGAGAGALAGSHHHHNKDSSHLGSGSGMPTTNSTSSQRAAGVDHADVGSSMARRMGGAYESGYRDGYRDAMEEKRRQV